MRNEMNLFRSGGVQQHAECTERHELSARRGNQLILNSKRMLKDVEF